jgi:hypothetical protein
MTNNKLIALCLASSLLGCATDASAPDELATIDQAVTCPTPTLVTNRSLVVTDPEALAKFPFKRVLTAITASAGTAITPLQLYKNWMATWGSCGPNIDPQGYGITCTRPETKFGLFNPFETTGPHFAPVALFNRFDLAPTSGADCGEYRVIYALQDSPGDRGFIIFEARLPNPSPASGLAGCAPVASFWASLSTDASATSRATTLEQFYFSGLSAGSEAFGPVVTAANYGLSATGAPTGSGQIRTNFFANFVQWHLREFKLSKPCAASATCKLSVAQVTVKNNPADELFRGTHPQAPAFQAAFLKQIPALSKQGDAKIAMTTADVFNEYESVSQATDVVYANFTQASFATQIAGAITNPNLAATDILHRATTQTCAGCHQLSNGTPNLGDGVVWQPSLTFVQVDEASNLSNALTLRFLPRRSQVLKAFLDQQCAGTAPVNDGLTLSGASIDAAN